MPSSLSTRLREIFDSSDCRVLVLVLLCLLVMGYNLGGNSLHNDDEAKHAVVAREAAVDGHWLPLTYNGKPYYSKPPLRIWLTAVTFESVGINEWSVRLWSGIFGAATVLALYLIGRRLWNERTAFLSALILLSSHQYIYNHCARTGETDSMLIFCWTAGLLLLQLAVEQGRRRLLFWSAVLIGLCGMVKHLGFVPIVLVIAAGYVLLARVWSAFPVGTWLTSLGLVATVALPWHLILWAQEGRAFLEAYFIGEVVDKRLEAGAPSQTWTSASQYVSLATLARGFFPWSYLLPFAILDLARTNRFRRDWLLPVLWLLVAMIATFVSGQKYTWYVLPAFPAAAILVAQLLDRFLGEPGDRLVRAAVLLGGLAALASRSDAATSNPFAGLARQTMLSVQFLGHLRGSESSLPGAVILWLVLAAGVVLALEWSEARKRASTWIARTHAFLVLILLGLALYTVLAPLRFSHYTSRIEEMALAVDENLTEGEVLCFVLPERRSRSPRFRYYFGTTPLEVVQAEALSTGDYAGRLVLTERKTLEELGVGMPLPILAEAEGEMLLRWPGL